MYLRETRRRNRDGSEVSYYQLAHNVWDPQRKRSKTQIVYNFGRVDALDRSALVRLCHSVARVCDLQIIDRQQTRAVLPDEIGLPEELTLLEARMFGVIFAVRQLCDQLGITDILSRIAKTTGAPDTVVTAIIALIANRLHRPASKLGVYARWLEAVYFPAAANLGKDAFYTAIDFLHDNAQDIEHDVFFAVANHLDLDVDLIFYDTTTAAFSVDEADADGPRQLGRNKDGGYRIQVVVALAVTRQGVPVRSWVLPGNTADVDTIEQVRSDLRGWKLSRVLLVADAGMDSQANRAALSRACGRYVLAVRSGSLKEVREEVLRRPGRYKRVAENLRVKEVVVGDGERRRRYILCHNPKQAARQKAHREQVVAELEAKLSRHRDRSSARKWTAQLRASHRYGRYLRVGKRGEVLLDRSAIRRAGKQDGKWVLITNDGSLSSQDVAAAYKGLMLIEGCFRTMKSGQLDLEPLYHRLESRIVGHVKLCVLSLVVERVIELRAGQPFSQIRPELERLQAVQFATPSHLFWQLNSVSPKAEALLKKLQIDRPKPVLAIRKREEEPGEG